MREEILDIFNALPNLSKFFSLMISFLEFSGVNWAETHCLKVLLLLLLLLTVSLSHPAL